MENFSKTGGNLVASANKVVNGNLGDSVSILSDLRLYELCKTYGKNALLWRQKFLGLLPEVAKRRLYEKHGFGSIFEFGFKLAGVSEKQIRRVLNLEERFKDKRVLHGLLVNGQVSVNKLARVASVVTAENETFWADQVKLLPKSTLETLIKDQESATVNTPKTESQNGLFEPGNGTKNVPGHTSKEFILADDVKAELNKLHNKGIDVNDLLRKFLEQRKEEIAEKKDKIAEELAQTLAQPDGQKTPSRHIPAKVKKIIQEEHGTKCAVPNCNKPSEHLHHALPFALTQNHDPHYLIPLCKDHHIIAHSINQQFQKMRQVAVT